MILPSQTSSWINIFCWSWNNITAQNHRPNPIPTHNLSQKSEGNDSWITSVQKHLTVVVSLKQTCPASLSFNSDWLIGMLFQDQQGCWSRNMLYLVKSHSPNIYISWYYLLETSSTLPTVAFNTSAEICRTSRLQNEMKYTNTSYEEVYAMSFSTVVTFSQSHAKNIHKSTRQSYHLYSNDYQWKL